MDESELTSNLHPLRVLFKVKKTKPFLECNRIDLVHTENF